MTQIYESREGTSNDHFQRRTSKKIQYTYIYIYIYENSYDD